MKGESMANETPLNMVAGYAEALVEEFKLWATRAPERAKAALEELRTVAPEVAKEIRGAAKAVEQAVATGKVTDPQKPAGGTPTA
jgi:predicted trehalose synthase